MSDLPNPDRPTETDDLHGPLRKAVEHIRKQPIPQDVLHRTLDRSQHLLSSLLVPRWGLRRAALAVTGLAAAVMLGLFVWPGWLSKTTQQTGQQVAQTTSHDSDGLGENFAPRRARSGGNGCDDTGPFEGSDCDTVRSSATARPDGTLAEKKSRTTRDVQSGKPGEGGGPGQRSIGKGYIDGLSADEAADSNKGKDNGRPVPRGESGKSGDSPGDGQFRLLGGGASNPAPNRPGEKPRSAADPRGANGAGAGFGPQQSGTGGLGVAGGGGGRPAGMMGMQGGMGGGALGAMGAMGGGGIGGGGFGGMAGMAGGGGMGGRGRGGDLIRGGADKPGAPSGTTGGSQKSSGERSGGQAGTPYQRERMLRAPDGKEQAGARGAGKDGKPDPADDTTTLDKEVREQLKNLDAEGRRKLLERVNDKGKGGPGAGGGKGMGRGEGQAGQADDESRAIGRPRLITREAIVPGKAEDKASDRDKYGQRAEEDRGVTLKASKSPDNQFRRPAKRVWRQRNGRPTFARVYLGDGNSLELVSLHVTVTVEGPRARTVVDHIFRNPYNRQLEGTFEYPLPTGASPSYFAMFTGQTGNAVPPRFARAANAPALPEDALARLTPEQLVKQVSVADWGTLREARVVPRAKALETYEEITRQRIDPALLEYAGGNTFSGRVFPIPPSGYNRVVFAYEELLPAVGDRTFYRYPLPDGPLTELHLTLFANSAECKDAVFTPKDSRKTEGGGRVSFHHTWKDEGPGGYAQFAFTPPRPDLQVISGRQGENGPLYLYARIRPELKAHADKPFAEHAVFLLDTSLSEYPDAFARNMALLRKVLETDPAIKHFNVLAFNVGTTWLNPKGWYDNTPKGRGEAFNRLDGLILEGATNVAAALDQLAEPGRLDAGTPLNVFLLSDGQITWGDSDVNTIVSRFEGRCPYRTRFYCYRTELRADNLELFDALTRRGGGIFNCFTDDVRAAAAAHRRQCWQIDRVRLVGVPQTSDVLVAGRKAAVYPDGELIVAARVQGAGRVTAVVEGTYLGKKFAQEYPLETAVTGELAPRGWAEIAVASLLALNDPKLDGLVTAYCQQFGIGSRVASFLVLENDTDYKRYNLEDERGKTVQGDLGGFLESAWRGLGEVTSAKQAFQQLLAQIGPRVQLVSGEGANRVRALLAVLTEKDFDVPAPPLAAVLVHNREVSPEYRQARDGGIGDVNLYITEARRRAEAGDPAGAVQVLSSIIEEYPTRGDALRLVGYRLLDLKQPAQAAALFRQVQRQRPFEPHSYLDLARALEACGKYGLAALQYEIVLAGEWDARFHSSLKVVAREEYEMMMRQAIRKKDLGKMVADRFGEYFEHKGTDRSASDLRVTISWNTDNTDVDLWVIEPDGTKCYFQNRNTPSGGELSEDCTQGYGPERYRIAKAKPGTYTVYVHYFSTNPNLLAGETHVNVVVTRFANTPQEKVERHTVILKHANEAVEVTKVRFE